MPASSKAVMYIAVGLHFDGPQCRLNETAQSPGYKLFKSAINPRVTSTITESQLSPMNNLSNSLIVACTEQTYLSERFASEDRPVLRFSEVKYIELCRC